VIQKDLNRDDIEFKALYFPLKPPRVVVDVENSATDKVIGNDKKWPPFRVGVEPGFKHVFDIFGVGGDCVAEDRRERVLSRLVSSREDAYTNRKHKRERF